MAQIGNIQEYLQGNTILESKACLSFLIIIFRALLSGRKQEARWQLPSLEMEEL